MHRVDNVLSLSTIPVVKIGMAMMFFPQKRSVSTPANVKVDLHYHGTIHNYFHLGSLLVLSPGHS